MASALAGSNFDAHGTRFGSARRQTAAMACHCTDCNAQMQNGARGRRFVSRRRRIRTASETASRYVQRVGDDIGGVALVDRSNDASPSTSRTTKRIAPRSTFLSRRISSSQRSALIGGGDRGQARGGNQLRRAVAFPPRRTRTPAPTTAPRTPSPPPPPRRAATRRSPAPLRSRGRTCDRSSTARARPLRARRPRRSRP